MPCDPTKNVHRAKTGHRPIVSSHACIENLEPRRLMAAGDLDATFGTNGLVFGTPNQGTITDSTRGPNGNLVLVSSTGVVLRFTSSGAVDTTFGTAGQSS